MDPEAETGRFVDAKMFILTKSSTSKKKCNKRLARQAGELIIKKMLRNGEKSGNEAARYTELKKHTGKKKTWSALSTRRNYLAGE